MYAATMTTIAAAALTTFRVSARTDGGRMWTVRAINWLSARLRDLPSRSASTLTIVSPWKRPFSMKMFEVSLPQIAPPARNTPGTFVSNVSGLNSGAIVSRCSRMPARRYRSQSG